MSPIAEPLDVEARSACQRLGVRFDTSEDFDMAVACVRWALAARDQRIAELEAGLRQVMYLAGSNTVVPGNRYPGGFLDIYMTAEEVLTPTSNT